MPAWMELPESAVFTFTHIPETVLGDLVNQILWQGLVVGNLKGAIGSLVLFHDRLFPRIYAQRIIALKSYITILHCLANEYIWNF